MSAATSRLFEDALGAVDDLLSDVYRLPLAKALDPQNPRDFLILQHRLASAVKGLTGKAEAASMRAAIDALDVDWASLSDDGREKVVLAARAVLAKPPPNLPEVGAAFKATGERTLVGAKKWFNEEFSVKISVNLTETDKHVVDHAANAQALYIRNQYGVRADALAANARKIVSAGLAQGLGRYDLAKDLRDGLQAQGVARSDAYWNMAAGVFINRSRVYGALSGFTAAKVRRFKFDAVLDEVTTIQCRFMHGRVFEVKDALDRYAAVATSENPEDVKTVQPWMGVSKGPDGRPVLHYKDASGAKQPVATVTDNALGQLDATGAYEGAMNETALAKAGLLTPPLHGNCRSTIRPVFGAAPRAAAPAPVPEASTEAAPEELPPLFTEADAQRPEHIQAALRQLEEARDPLTGKIAPTDLGFPTPDPAVVGAFRQLLEDIDVALLPKSFRDDIPLSAVHLTDEEGVLASEIAGKLRRRFSGTDDPVVAEIAPGKFVVFENGYALAAEDVLNQNVGKEGGKVGGYVIDLTEARRQAKPLTAKQFADSFAKGAEGLAADGGKVLRESLRGFLRKEGLDSRDIAYVLERPNAIVPGTDGSFHHWDGRVELKASRRRVLPAAARKLRDGEKLDAEEQEVFRVLVHEELHGATPMGKGAYRPGTGAVAMEEASTEVLARHLLRKRFPAGAFPDLAKDPKPEKDPNPFILDQGAYDGYIRAAHNGLVKYAGVKPEDAPAAFIRGALKFKGAKNRGKRFETPEEYENAFCDALGIKDAAKRAAFREYMKAAEP